jgi:hypothetical protein
MEKFQPLTHDSSRIGGGGQVVPQRRSDLTSKHARHEVLEPVSWSSALNEDRLYRAAKAIDGGGDLVEVADKRFVESDQRFQRAVAEGASPMMLAAMEKMHATYYAGSAFVIGDVMTRPYERY